MMHVEGMQDSSERNKMDWQTPLKETKWIGNIPGCLAAFSHCLTDIERKMAEDGLNMLAHVLTINDLAHDLSMLNSVHALATANTAEHDLCKHWGC
jgi:hypothetical protein